MIPPIKRGTARRLGIRQPKPLSNYPQRWMLGMQEAVNNMHANMAAVAHAMGVGAADWRPLPQPTKPEIYIPGSAEGPARFVVEGDGP